MTINPLRLLFSGGNAAAARMSQWRSLARHIVKCSDDLASLTDSELERRGRELAWQANSGVNPRRLLPETYSLVREASHRAHGQRHYPVQLIAGIALYEGGIAEMQTGEGKTLTALLPACLHALAGKGCHVVTANDYLARRDADFAAAVFERLGMTVGCVEAAVPPPARGPEYAADITYGTAKEIGFDFLRDCLKLHGKSEEQQRRRYTAHADEQYEPVVQRGLHFALVDEADSILIDDAKTPLLIAVGEENDTESVGLFRWCARATTQLQPEIDFHYNERRRSVCLTDAGCRRTLSLPKPAVIDGVDSERLYRQVERAITAELAFTRDRDYVIAEEEIAIVDESTGRVMDGRKWQDGLHQAIEAKERVPVTIATRPAARITVQRFFNRYPHVAGLTGTAVQASREFKRVYGLGVNVVPTHRPCLRFGAPPRIFTTKEAKLRAVSWEITQLSHNGRAVLVGTPSVEASEALSKVLQECGIEHQVLNCRNHEEEAEIVARAGEAGRVTVATNMAGRGTDIKLDEAVERTGGLHVIATEIHSSARIDRQLIGRTARQGEPGSYQFFLSLDDELLRVLRPKRLQSLKRRAKGDPQGELSRGWLSLFVNTQQMLERHHKKTRRVLLKQEQERNKRYEKMGLDPHLEMTDE